MAKTQPILTDKGITDGWYCYVCGDYYPLDMMYLKGDMKDFSGDLWNLMHTPTGSEPETPVVCMMCSFRCQHCNDLYPWDTGFHNCELDNEGFLNGNETHLCNDCFGTDIMIEQLAAPCLSNTPKLSKDDE